MSRRLRAVVLVLAALTACSKSEPSINQPVPGSPDAGHDAGPLPEDDAGTADAGIADAGTQPRDAGTYEPPRLESTRCPSPEAAGIGTNTAIRVHATNALDAASVSSNRFRVSLDGVDLPGQVEVSGQDLTFLPQSPLPPERTLQVSLSGSVLDVYGQALAKGGATWTFTTERGPTPSPGFRYTPPVMPPRGEHAPSFDLVMEGERAILTWRNAFTLLATSVEGTTFSPPLTVFTGAPVEQISMATGGGAVHFAWTYFNGPGTVYYQRADLSLKSPATAPLDVSPASYIPKVATGQRGEVAVVFDIHPDYWNPWGGRINSSTDNGDTFPTFSLIDSRAKCPDALYVDGRLVVAWQQSLIQAGDEMYVSVSDDNGLTFNAPIKVAEGAQLWCPSLVDDRAGRALVVWQEGSAFGPRASWVRGFAPGSDELGEPVQLTAPDEALACTRLVSTPSGKMALVSSRGHSFQRDWVTEVSLSEDGGRTFGAPHKVDVIDPGEGCPAAGLSPAGDLYLAWMRNSLELRVSHGKPLHPCE